MQNYKSNTAKKHNIGNYQKKIDDHIQKYLKEFFQPYNEKLYKFLGKDFKWQTDAYEYENDKKAIDLINGGTELTHWVEENRPLIQLLDQQKEHIEQFRSSRQKTLLY